MVSRSWFPLPGFSLLVLCRVLVSTGLIIELLIPCIFSGSLLGTEAVISGVMRDRCSTATTRNKK